MEQQSAGRAGPRPRPQIRLILSLRDKPRQGAIAMAADLENVMIIRKGHHHPSNTEIGPTTNFFNVGILCYRSVILS